MGTYIFRFRWLALAMVGITAAVMPHLVQADTYAVGSPNGGEEPDNKNHGGCVSTGEDWIPYALYDFWWDWLPANTTVTRFFHDPCRSGTDMRFSWQYGGPMLGRYQCQQYSGSECDVALVEQWDAYYVNNYPGAQTQGTPYWCHTIHNWCHEVGHSLGLTHTGGGGCLASGDLDACHFLEMQKPSPHHVWHINNDIN